jgi:molecular chaperone GrpE
MHHSHHHGDSKDSCCKSHKESKCCRSPDSASEEFEPIEDLHSSKEETLSISDEKNTAIDAANTSKEGDQDEFKDKYLRLLAENENMRRRFQRESQESIRYAAQKIILDLLDPFDNFEKALSHAGHSSSEEVRNWAIGFKMIHQQFKDWLNAQGVHSFVSKDQPFSAQLHEAVETVATNQVREGTIMEEYAKGYKMHDRVLRPAKVSIAKPLSTNAQSVTEAESDLDDDELSSNNHNI